MNLVEKHVVKPGNSFYPEIDNLCFLSKNLYNLGNYHIRQEFFKSGNCLSYPDLNRILICTEDYKALPAKVSQQVLIVLCRNWKAFLEAVKEYKISPGKFYSIPKIPHYKDKKEGRNLLIYTIQALNKKELKKGYIVLSKTSMRFKSNKQGIKQVRIIPRMEHYVVEMVYEIPDVIPLIDNGKVAGIDMGLNNLASVTSNDPDFKPFLINGRPLKSINSFYNKTKAKLQEQLPKKIKTSKKIRKLTEKRNWKIDDYLHKSSSCLIDQLVIHQISTLVIGKNDNWKQNISLGKRTNQNFVSIPHSRFIEQLTYKAEMKGIKVITTEESYTSKCSFIDDEKLEKHTNYKGKRVHRGLFQSAEGILINADINGSYNIIRKVFPKFHYNGIKGYVVTPIRFTSYKLVD